MSKHQERRSEWGDGVYIRITPADPAAVKVDRPLALGADGLFGIPEGPVTTPESFRAGTALKSTRVGETVVNLPGIGQIRDMGVMPASVAEFGKVYYDAATDTLSAAGAFHIGYRYGTKVLIRNN